MINTVLPTLLDMLNSIDLNVRHGAVLATAEILEALYNHLNDKIENIIGERECALAVAASENRELKIFIIHFEHFYRANRFCVFRCYGRD